MKCPNCGNENAVGMNFCENCGTKLESEVSYSEQTQPTTPEEQFTAPEYNPTTPEKASFADKLKENKGIIKKAVIILAIIVAAILVILGIKSCAGGGKQIDVKELPIIYANDDESKFLKNSGAKVGYELADEDEAAGNLKITSDGKYIFFGMDGDGGEFDLCYRNTSKKSSDANVTVVKGISEYEISSDGSVIFYIKNGTLYRCSRNGKNPVKFGKDVSYFTVADDFKAVLYENEDGEVYYSTGLEKIHNKVAEDSPSYFFTEDEKTICLIENEYDDDYNSKYTVSVCGLGKKDKAEKLISNVDDYTFADRNSDKLYYIKNEKLYFKDGKKDGSVVSGIDGDLVSINRVEDSDKENKFHFYAVSINDNDDDYEYNLYYVDGKKAKLLIEDCDTSSYYGNYVVYKYEYDYDSDKDKSEYWLRVDYDKFVELDIPKEDGRAVDYEATADSFFTIENVNDKGKGDLVKYDITSKGVNFSKGTTVAEDVKSVDGTWSSVFDKDFVVVYHGDNEYSIYNGGKTAKEIDAEISESLYVQKDGTMIILIDYNSKNGTYTLAKYDGKNVSEIADDVKSALLIDEKTIYYTNDDDELMLNKGKRGSDKLIDEDVNYIVDPLYYVVTDEKNYNGKVDSTKADIFYNTGY